MSKRRLNKATALYNFKQSLLTSLELDDIYDDELELMWKLYLNDLRKVKFITFHQAKTWTISKKDLKDD